MGKLAHFFFAIGWMLLLGSTAQAKLFTNKFIEFQLPDKWECNLDASDWVCQSTDEQKKRDAIIVLVAKMRKEGRDELELYKKHLEEKQVYEAPNGQKVMSEPRYVKQIVINNKAWIDAIHMQSEIPDFVTRYLVTTEADLGILATFSVRKDKFQDYATEIEAMAKSIRVFRTPGALVENVPAATMDGIQENGNAPGSLLAEVKCPPNHFRNLKNGHCDPNPERNIPPIGMLVIAGIFFLIFLAAFLIRKIRKNK